MKEPHLEIKRVNLEDLKDHPKNSELRAHPSEGTEEWEALRKSLSIDYFDPIVFNEVNGMLVSGHLRKKILISNGHTSVDVVVVRYSENKHLARMIAANKQSGNFLEDGLDSFLKIIESCDFDSTGLSSSDLDFLNGDLKETESEDYFDPIDTDNELEVVSGESLREQSEAASEPPNRIPEKEEPKVKVTIMFSQGEHTAFMKDLDTLSSKLGVGSSEALSHAVSNTLKNFY